MTSWMTEIRTLDDHLRIFSALSDVSFDVEQGEVFGIISVRNGAGKSTLLKILFQDHGSHIRQRGHQWPHQRSLLEVGTGFHPELTGRENVYLNGSIFRRYE